MAEILIGNIKGEKGDAGSGLKILEHYNTYNDMIGNVLRFEAGNAYSVGTEPPFDIYVFSESLGFVNYGKLQVITVEEAKQLRADIDFILVMTSLTDKSAYELGQTYCPKYWTLEQWHKIFVAEKVTAEEYNNLLGGYSAV